MAKTKAKKPSSESKKSKKNKDSEIPTKEQLEEASKILIDQISDKLEDKNLFGSVVDSFSRIPECEDVIYTWVYNFIDKKNLPVSLEFQFKSIPMREFNRIEELIPMPIAEQLPIVNQATGEPVLNEDGTCKTRSVEDDNYIKQKEKASNHKTIALIEVSLGYQVPGDNYDEKYSWFLDHPLTMWRSMYQIIWTRLLGGGLVNFT